MRVLKDKMAENVSECYMKMKFCDIIIQISPREANRKSEKLFPIVKMAEKLVGIPINC